MKKKISLKMIVAVVAAIVLAVVCGILLRDKYVEYHAVSLQKKVVAIKQANIQKPDTAEVSVQQDIHNEPPIQSEEDEQQYEPVIQPDFLSLYQENPHIVGWLNAGEVIDYAVVQFDNEFYLHNDFFGNKDRNGTPFLNMNNSLYPKDDVLLIHGHNLNTPVAFGTLMQYMNEAYLYQYPIITFRTIYDEQDVFYTPIAAFNASMNKQDPDYFDATRINFEEDGAFQAYLNELEARSLWQSKADAKPGDQMLALITCSYYQDNGRLLLICRQLRDEETPETIRMLYDADK